MELALRRRPPVGAAFAVVRAADLSAADVDAAALDAAALDAASFDPAGLDPAGLDAPGLAAVDRALVDDAGLRVGAEVRLVVDARFVVRAGLAVLDDGTVEDAAAGTLDAVDAGAAAVAAAVRLALGDRVVRWPVPRGRPGPRRVVRD